MSIVEKMASNRWAGSFAALFSTTKFDSGEINFLLKQKI